MASDVLRKTNAALVNKYEKGKLSQLEDSSDDEDQKDTLAPIKKRIVLNGSGSESEADDELDDDVGEAEYQDQVTISDSDSSGTEDGFIVDSDEENERRSTRQNRKKPRLYYGAPSLQEYQDINDQDERMIVKKKRDKYMMGFSYSVPLYTDDEFIEKHADDCYVCSKDGYPNGANNDLREVAAGPMAKKRRLLLCKTCTLSCHNSCLAQSADKSFDKHGNFVCSKCRLPTIAKCGICSSLKKEESILFRCSLCFRGLHKSCRTPADDDCYSQYNQCYECHKYVYNNIAAEKVLAQKTVNDKAMVLIKWKNLSYRHVAWVYTSWFEHASKTMYRAYLVKAANGDIPSGSPGPALEEWKQIDRILSIEWADKRQENAKRVFAVYKDTAYDEGKYI